MLNKVMLSVFIGAIMGCTAGEKGESPQKVLSEYVSRSFSVASPPDKAKLLELTTGEVRKTIEAMDEALFKNSFVNAKRDFLGLKIRDEKKISDDKYSIVYELSYMSKTSTNNQQNADKVTSKKYALFEKRDGKWYIAEVKSQKTMIEHQNEMSF